MVTLLNIKKDRTSYENEIATQSKIRRENNELKLANETKPRVKFGNLRLTVPKQGTLKQKYT